MLAADDASLVLGGKAIVEQASLSVEAGTLTVILGPNGAGKTSLFSLLAGERRPATGKVTLGQRPLDRVPARERARTIAVLSQNTHLDFAFRTDEVVGLGRLPHGDDEEHGRGKILAAAALRAVGLSGFASRLYPTLSGGEQQRVQLARCLAQLDLMPGEQAWEEPRYLLLDEPTTSLDPAHQISVLALARDLARRGVGVLAILHDLSLAGSIADRLVLMSRGRIVAAGTPQDVLTADRIEEVYGLACTVIPNPTGHGLIVAPRIAA